MPTAAPARQTTDHLDNRELLRVLMAVKRGDFSVRLPVDYTGTAGKIADTLNEIIDLNQRMTQQLDRISTVVGKEGRIDQRMSLGAPGGAWTAGVESVNALIGNLAQPTTEVARVIGAVAKGDLSQIMTMEIASQSEVGGCSTGRAGAEALDFRSCHRGEGLDAGLCARRSNPRSNARCAACFTQYRVVQSPHRGEQPGGRRRRRQYVPVSNT